MTTIPLLDGMSTAHTREHYRGYPSKEHQSSQGKAINSRKLSLPPTHTSYAAKSQLLTQELKTPLGNCSTHTNQQRSASPKEIRTHARACHKETQLLSFRSPHVSVTSHSDKHTFLPTRYCPYNTLQTAGQARLWH